MKNLAILSSYNGSGFNAIYNASLKNLLDVSVKVVISNNTNSVVLQNAAKYDIDNYLVNFKTDINPDEKIYSLLKEYKCEYVFLSGYMKKLSPLITANFKVINSHPSLLPKYGGKGMFGRKVHDAVVKNSELFSGVTIHEVNEHYDDGKIILQTQLTLSKNESAETLEVKIKKLEQKTIINGIKLHLS